VLTDLCLRDAILSALSSYYGALMGGWTSQGADVGLPLTQPEPAAAGPSPRTRPPQPRPAAAVAVGGAGEPTATAALTAKELQQRVEAAVQLGGVRGGGSDAEAVVSPFLSARVLGHRA
jgi:hypothetical protein